MLLTCLPSIAVALAAWPGFAGEWPRAAPAEMGLDEAALAQARDYALTGEGSGCVMRGGKLVYSWGDRERRYELKSTTKSIGVTALGLAIQDGKLSLTDRAVGRHPAFGVPPESNAETGWLGKVTLLHLATQTAGFAKPGGYEALQFEPGTKWLYSDGGPNWLAECVTLAYREDLDTLMFERVFGPLGIGREDLVWRENDYRPHEIEGVKRREFGSGISANVDAMARIGMLYLRGGEWEGRPIIPRDFVDRCRTTVPSVVGLPEADDGAHGNASDHYGLLWWNNADGTLAGVPRDAYWSWGLYDSLIVVIPSLDLVVARAGKSWQRDEGSEDYDVLRPFFQPIAASVRTAAPVAAAPCPSSTSIVGLDWAPAASIVRQAEGSDNWPLTWADDDAQYTAYGDGWGFAPHVTGKLSLGLARVTGGPEGFEGANIPSATGEQTGDGKAGRKASGMLMVDGVLYMWARNAGNAQLAWSDDHARTWRWVNWRLTESFGCPTFLNFGRDYEGARDEYVYIYSPDSDSAYEPADRMVLARAPKGRLRSREAYDFLAGVQDGAPRWAKDITQRAAVLTNPGKCYRSGVSYDAGLRRYLWCQTLPGGDEGPPAGLAIYDAPEPWGPWTTVCCAEPWDVAPGESASLPTKWMSEDGRTVHLVFSGEDSFSVRRAVLLTAADR